MHYTSMTPVLDRPGTKPGTLGLVDECSTTELTLLLKYDER